MLLKIRLLSALCLLSFFIKAQTPPVKQPQPAPPTFNYKKINPQLSYAFIIDKPGKIHPQEGDQVSLNMLSIYDNKPMYSTSMAFKGKPGVYGVIKPAYTGDLIEAIMLMTPGDSIVCLVDADALYKNANTKRPDFIKAGAKFQYFIKLVSIKPKEQVQKEQQDAFMKLMKEQQAKQMSVDDKALKKYFTSHHISPVKTASGFYYTIHHEGAGEKAIPGDTVIVNYTGTLMDGTKFDSNEDTAFQHVYPYQFILGRGMVIKGWDEGFALLKPGAKATFYIPSQLAYGSGTRPGSPANPKGIPANSVLLFDVQLFSSKHPVPGAMPAPKIDSLRTPVKEQ
jgi:FKBP-type peptidyl-prolyl cis-trans isomerase FkpA